MANLVVAINLKHTSGFGEHHTDLVRKKFFDQFDNRDP